MHYYLNKYRYNQLESSKKNNSSASMRVAGIIIKHNKRHKFIILSHLKERCETGKKTFTIHGTKMAGDEFTKHQFMLNYLSNSQTHP